MVYLLQTCTGVNQSIYKIPNHLPLLQGFDLIIGNSKWQSSKDASTL